jgi:hypothetical protein
MRRAFGNAPSGLDILSLAGVKMASAAFNYSFHADNIVTPVQLTGFWLALICGT